jgi:hypothetical protein
MEVECLEHLGSRKDGISATGHRPCEPPKGGFAAAVACSITNASILFGSSSRGAHLWPQTPLGCHPALC